MKKLLAFISILTVVGCVSTKPANRDVASVTEGVPQFLRMKTTWELEPVSDFMIQKDKLVPAKLPNGVVCYVISKSEAPVSFTAGDRVPVLEMTRYDHRNITTIHTEHFNLNCTLSVVVWNTAVSLEKIKKETAEFFDIE